MEFYFKGRTFQLFITKTPNEEGIEIISFNLLENGNTREIVKFTGAGYYCPVCGKDVLDGKNNFSIRVNEFLSTDNRMRLKISSSCSRNGHSIDIFSDIAIDI
ncbi:MAG: hypothetical protein UR60_C0004G0006 [Candidatus Moranbacteria bacterium GW2011_GWF2_34_56]|nr:MAG: hypothetical protein UR51_C0010G0067 [Candidatus Moranbacteria bacterium GW2011_GWF1_34_10]KKP65277.1 MAG: hypothetical protein UR60_C0004G0006 [Candidatus Moranbacteria bacterium GW2011_GWF2_34_56]HBI16878.1 hypothetical protein [Candidatus Moranbacteria bacterium]